MKPLIVILAFFVLLLSVVPCCMFDNCNEDEVKKECSTAKQVEKDGLCSPFSSCSACCGFTVSMQIVSFETKPKLIITHYSFYTDNYLSVYHLSIWQPPKQA
ncbi:hypothetical protein C3K47_03180 [Solitalea longa]|uniref:Uncharacterized protein n=1 Tax=Solitalea longa TaxID=2079460 RepID=A0A2S5A7C8_9SPHI|nr:DUF6660 family protein [Solitalea longa]POY38416.1 hypothetical protein C3K47_03180 [Solitalea longa]